MSSAREIHERLLIAFINDCIALSNDYCEVSTPPSVIGTSLSIITVSVHSNDYELAKSTTKLVDNIAVEHKMLATQRYVIRGNKWAYFPTPEDEFEHHYTLEFRLPPEVIFKVLQAETGLNLSDITAMLRGAFFNAVLKLGADYDDLRTVTVQESAVSRVGHIIDVILRGNKGLVTRNVQLVAELAAKYGAELQPKSRWQYYKDITHYNARATFVFPRASVEKVDLSVLDLGE